MRKVLLCATVALLSAGWPEKAAAGGWSGGHGSLSAGFSQGHTLAPLWSRITGR